MEKGVVPGPQGSRWHSACLVCGGKAATAAIRKGLRNPEEPGCGKKLDSAAKTDGEGGVWCRECRVSFLMECLPCHEIDSSLFTNCFTR